MFRINKGILFKNEERITWNLSWWEIMTTKWYEWIGDKIVVWDLRERIDQFKNDSSIVYYLADLTPNELLEFRDYIIWNETFWNKVKHREDLKKYFKQEFEECEEKFYDWDNEEYRYPTDTGDYKL